MARLIPEINPKINLRDLVGLILVMMPPCPLRRNFYAYMLPTPFVNKFIQIPYSLNSLTDASTSFKRPKALNYAMEVLK